MFISRDLPGWTCSAKGSQSQNLTVPFEAGQAKQCMLKQIKGNVAQPSKSPNPPCLLSVVRQQACAGQAAPWAHLPPSNRNQASSTDAAVTSQFIFGDCPHIHARMPSQSMLVQRRAKAMHAHRAPDQAPCPERPGPKTCQPLTAKTSGRTPGSLHCTAARICRAGSSRGVRAAQCQAPPGSPWKVAVAARARPAQKPAGGVRAARAQHPAQPDANSADGSPALNPTECGARLQVHAP